jgi:hypothetical protein
MSEPSRPPEPPAPRAVSRFEYNLVHMLRGLLGHVPLDQVRKTLTEKHAAPECLSPAAVHLVKDSLSKGLVLYLVRAGGWRRERFLRAGKPVGGRVWERIPLGERKLRFSEHTLSFLVWLTAEKPTEPKQKWDPLAEELTPADELFFMVVLDAVRPEPGIVEVLRAKDAFARNAFCWLSRPADFADANEPRPPTFASLFEGTRVAILECLQPALAQKWVRSERAKGQIGDWKRIRAEGTAEFATLSAFLDAAEKANRTDLARFLLSTLSSLLSAIDLAPSYWLGGLHGPGPPRLADRLGTQRAGLAVPRQAETLARWDRRARAVGYFDEEYAASQLWKEDWESHRGGEIVATARRVVEQLEPLRVTTDGPRG